MQKPLELDLFWCIGILFDYFSSYEYHWKRSLESVLNALNFAFYFHCDLYVSKGKIYFKMLVNFLACVMKKNCSVHLWSICCVLD